MIYVEFASWIEDRLELEQGLEEEEEKKQVPGFNNIMDANLIFEGPYENYTTETERKNIFNDIYRQFVQERATTS